MIIIQRPIIQKFLDVLSIFNRFFLKLFTFLLFFTVIALMLKPTSLFYEWDIYIHYFRSILSDGDFNIINQVPEEMRWLVTKKFFHPDHHPESQVAAMLPFYFFEYCSRLLTKTTYSESFVFQLTTIAINCFSLLLGTFFIKKSANELMIKAKNLDFLLFYIGSPVLYFSLLQTTVIEIVAFPLLSYLLLICIRLKKQIPLTSPFTVGIVSAFLVITKATFWPICLFVFILCAKVGYKQKKYLHLVFLVLSFLPIFLADIVNRTVKYGSFTSSIPPIALFNDFSFENIFNNLSGGFFAKGGLFFANPMYLIATAGLLFLFKNLYDKKILNWLDVCALLSWCILVFFNHIFLIGYIVEDHLPGRIHLAIAPLLILGIIYFRNAPTMRYASKYWYLFLTGCSLWHIIITFNYIIVEFTSFYIYSINTFPSRELFIAGFETYTRVLVSNFSEILKYRLQIATFVFLIALFATGLMRLKNLNNVLKLFTASCALIYISMIVLNLVLHSGNIEKLKQQNFYSNSAIGDGKEIFHIDYVLDFVKTIKSRNNPKINEKIKLMTQDYYSKVKKQVIKSTPELDAAIATNSLDFSFMILMNKKE